ncbi:unnamed protein product [Boreogadus saida]
MFSGLHYQTRAQMFSGLSDQTRAQMFPLSSQKQEGPAPLQAQRLPPGGSRWGFGILVVTSCVGAVLAAAMTITCLRRHAHRLAARKLGLGPEGGSFTHQEYQDLCRQHMASRGAFGRLEAAALGAAAGPGGGGAGRGPGVGGGATAGVGGGADGSRVSSVSSQFSEGAAPSPGSHSSTPSWCEEPAQANMDISTGHMVLAYMEDHLRNKDRLLQEWEALCSYQAEPSAVSSAHSPAHLKKNRSPDFVPYDHSRVKLRAEVNPSRDDYINASTIIEHDPRMPAYIATQGPLSHTISDFWQMVWENGCTVIVMLTALVEDGEKQCDRYWPDEGSSLYHIYEVDSSPYHINSSPYHISSSPTTCSSLYHIYEVGSSLYHICSSLYPIYEVNLVSEQTSKVQGPYSQRILGLKVNLVSEQTSMLLVSPPGEPGFPEQTSKRPEVKPGVRARDL